MQHLDLFIWNEFLQFYLLGFGLLDYFSQNAPHIRSFLQMFNFFAQFMGAFFDKEFFTNLKLSTLNNI